MDIFRSCQYMFRKCWICFKYLWRRVVHTRQRGATPPAAPSRRRPARRYVGVVGGRIVGVGGRRSPQGVIRRGQRAQRAFST